MEETSNYIETKESMQFKDLVAVHLTNYFPESGKIECLNSKFPNVPRVTTHFSINKPVENISYYGNWDNKKYAVIIPFDKLVEDNTIGNFNFGDTYFLGDVNLPKGSLILDSSFIPITNKELSKLSEKGIKYARSNDVRKDAEIAIQQEGYKTDLFGEEKIAEQLGTTCGGHSNSLEKAIEENLILTENAIVNIDDSDKILDSYDKYGNSPLSTRPKKEISNERHSSYRLLKEKLKVIGTSHLKDKYRKDIFERFQKAEEIIRKEAAHLIYSSA